MAVYRNGGPSGSVGPYVQYQLNGETIIRRLPVNHVKKDSAESIANQFRHTITNDLVKTIEPYLILGLGKAKWYQAGMKFNKPHVTVNFPNYEVDFAKLTLSQGKLSPPANAEANWVAGQLVLTWDAATYNKYSEATDQLMVLVYHDPGIPFMRLKGGSRKFDRLERADATILPGSRRGTGKFAFTPGREFAGKKVHVWMGFVELGGKGVSESVYMGEWEVIV